MKEKALTKEAKMGSSIVAVAVLEVNSVKNVIRMQRMRAMPKSGIELRAVSSQPIHNERPDFWKTRKAIIKYTEIEIFLSRILQVYLKHC